MDLVVHDWDPHWTRKIGIFKVAGGKAPVAGNKGYRERQPWRRFGGILFEKSGILKG